MMERDPNCSKEILYELCESRLCNGIHEEILGGRMMRGGIYMMLVEDKRGKFLVKK
jgi:hypothetical protein